MGTRAIVVLAVLAALGAGCKRAKDDRTPIQLSLGTANSCAVMKDQSIRCWGMMPGANTSLVPVRVEGRWIFRQVATGAGHACAKVGDDEHPPFRVVCWGANGSGQVGEAAAPSEPQNPIDLDALDVAAGGDSSCARLRDATVWCWGAIARSPKPTSAKLGKVAQVVLGKGHACARLEDGVFSTTLLQLNTEDRFRGRVFAADMALCMLTIAIGAYLCGAFLDWGVSVRLVATVTGLAMLLPAGLWLWVMRGWGARGGAIGVETAE